jgi:hypothetical protein
VPTVPHDVNWLQVAQLVLSILGLLSGIVVAIIGFLARGWLAAIKAELSADLGKLAEDVSELRTQHVATLAKMDMEREAIRKEHREDVTELRKGLVLQNEHFSKAIERVHIRIDEAAKTYVPQAHCAVVMEAAREGQDKISGILQDGIKEIRGLVQEHIASEGRA